jgi:hypothetical protein
MPGRTLYFTDVNDKHIIRPEASHVLKLNSIGFEVVAVQSKMVVVSGACNKLHSISSHGIFIPVRDPLKGQLAVLALN